MMVGVAVRLDPPDVRRSRSLATARVARAWTAEQLAAGLDGPTPEDRKDGSDYNLHVPEMEATGEALDELFGATP